MTEAFQAECTLSLLKKSTSSNPNKSLRDRFPTVFWVRRKTLKLRSR